ncbi:hypothetical protein [Streptomyces anulatus]|uniref:hypothetical protein n=1 Tax=Streptomyces anulatus TaxID=1892 RepID=UPI00363108F1
MPSTPRYAAGTPRVRRGYAANACSAGAAGRQGGRGGREEVVDRPGHRRAEEEQILHGTVQMRGRLYVPLCGS